MQIRPATGGDGALWVAEGEGRVAGTVGVAPRDGGAWEVERLCVAPPHRGRGLARRLLSVASVHARQRGAERLEVWTGGRFTGDRLDGDHQLRGKSRAPGRAITLVQAGKALLEEALAPLADHLAA